MNKPVVSLVGCTFALLLAAFPLFAQSGQVLKGGVQENVNPPSDQQVQTLVLDMYHQLSIMWGNPSASQTAQKTFQADVTEFNSYVSAGIPFASALAPCVSKYQQAYPHVVLQSQYYAQNNSSAFNGQGAIANPLIKAGQVASTARRATNSPSAAEKPITPIRTCRRLRPDRRRFTRHRVTSGLRAARHPPAQTATSGC